MAISIHAAHLKRAIELALENIHTGQGGPFGAVIVKDGKVIAESGNKVALQNDPTAHAEVSAIRLAGQALNTFDLSGCIIYTSCEPCPMCLSAIYWARIESIYYAYEQADAAEAGFNDRYIYEELKRNRKDRDISSEQIMPEHDTNPFELWVKTVHKVHY